MTVTHMFPVKVPETYELALGVFIKCIHPAYLTKHGVRRKTERRRKVERRTKPVKQINVPKKEGRWTEKQRRNS